MNTVRVKTGRIAWAAATAAVSLFAMPAAHAADAGPGRDAAPMPSAEGGACGKDTDCPGSTCGDQVCHWPDGICVPALSDAGMVDLGWCTADTDCKCQPSGAVCLPPSSGQGPNCSFTTPRSPDAGTCSKDTDCPGRDCGGQVCRWPDGVCVPAGSDPGWCNVASDCKCMALGAVCNPPSSGGFSQCSLTAPPQEGGASESGTATEGGPSDSSTAGEGGASDSGVAEESGGGGSSEGGSDAGSQGSGGSSGCNCGVAKRAETSSPLTVLALAGAFVAMRRRRRSSALSGGDAT